MPILAIDKFGRYYETDPDSSEGDGCKGEVPTSVTGDVSFDNSISQADNYRQLDRARTNAGFAALDVMEEAAIAKENRLRAARAAKFEQDNFNAHRPETIRRLVNTGLNQSKMLNSVVEGNIGLSGNGMTSNGLTGKAGMGRQEMGAQIALGLNIFRRADGSLVAPRADQVSVPSESPYADEAAITQTDKGEQEQHKARQLMERQIIANALKQARINELEARAAGFTEEEGEYISSQDLQRPTTARAPVTMEQARNSLPAQAQATVHPMFLIFLIQKPQGA